MGAEAHSDFVLIVDDEEGIRDSLREVVEMGGGSAMVAANGVEALRILASRRPSLVIVDWLMPVMSGAELVEAMRQNPALRGLPIVISTSSPESVRAGLPVLPKPVDIRRVWDWMRLYCHCDPPDSA